MSFFGDVLYCLIKTSLKALPCWSWLARIAGYSSPLVRHEQDKNVKHQDYITHMYSLDLKFAQKSVSCCNTNARLFKKWCHPENVPVTWRKKKPLWQSAHNCRWMYYECIKSLKIDHINKGSKFRSDQDICTTMKNDIVNTTLMTNWENESLSQSRHIKTLQQDRSGKAESSALTHSRFTTAWDKDRSTRHAVLWQRNP